MENSEVLESKKTRKIKNHFVKGNNINYDKIQKRKNMIGALGEEIVFEYLNNIAEKYNFKKTIHVSKEKGDGFGYDILFFNENEEEIRIEVKTTTSKYSDRFEMTQNELKVSLDKNYPYKIYRIYNFNIDNKECKLKIYDGPIDSENFVLETQCVKVYKK